jgi:hypothetical protein
MEFTGSFQTNRRAPKNRSFGGVDPERTKAQQTLHQFPKSNAKDGVRYKPVTYLDYDVKKSKDIAPLNCIG